MRRTRSRRLLYASLAAVVLVATGLWATWWWYRPPPGLSAYATGALTRWSKVAADKQRGIAPRHTYVPLARISPSLRFAVVAGEDVGFLHHPGFELSAMREALTEWWHGERLRGGSTITQQLAKNLFLSEERSFWRKLVELHYAFWLEQKLGKRRILELYLNIVELGPGIYGVEEGARHYFASSAAALDARRAAELAAAIPSPHKHNPTTRTRSWQIRYDAIRERMAKFSQIESKLAAW